MNSQSNLLFYSLSCNSCKILMNYLKQHQLEQYFKYICVENYKGQPILNNIKSVPTVIMKEFNQILVGKDIFLFLQNIVNNRRRILTNNTTVNTLGPEQPQTNNQQTNNQQTNNQQQYQKKILDFVPNEMSGFSDKYAYTFADIPSTQSFVNYNNQNANILTGEELPKITPNNQTQHVKQVENNRKKQDEELNNYFATQQSNSNKIIEQRKIIDNKINEIVLKHQTELFKK